MFPDADRALARYHAIEPGLQAGGQRTYRQVLTDVVPAIAHAEGWPIPDDPAALAASLPTWPPFPEVPARPAPSCGSGAGGSASCRTPTRTTSTPRSR